jgi:hypothetical protein
MPPSKKKSVGEDEPCGCDADFRTADLADDEVLPVAFGGVEVEGEGEEADGCDIFFGGGSTTSDEDLPAATGGVE